MTCLRLMVASVIVFIPLWNSSAEAELLVNTTVLNAAEGDSFDFSRGKVNPSTKADIALVSTDDGKGVFFRSGKVRDMGQVSLESVMIAPQDGYTEGSQLLEDHTYCLATTESHYVKFHISHRINNSLMYRLNWVYQSDGSQDLSPAASTSIITPTTWGKIKVLFR